MDISTDILVETAPSPWVEKGESVIRALQHWNLALVRSRTEVQLFHELCRIFVDELGLCFAWVGEVSQGGDRTIQPLAQAGSAHGYFDEVTVSWDDAPALRGPAGEAVRTRRPALADDIADSPPAHWHSAALTRGFRSALALPLIIGGEVWGVVCAYHPAPRSFSPDGIAMLAQLADNLASWLLAMREREQARRRCREHEAGEKRLRMLLGKSGDMLMQIDGDGTLRDMTPSVQHTLGIDPSGLLGRSLFTFLHSADLADFAGVLRRAIGRSDAAPSHLRLRHADGGWRSCRVRISNLDDEPPGAGFILTLRDTTEQERLEADLRFMAFHDQLTGLGNRRKLQDRLKQLLAAPEAAAAFFHIDLDRYKVVNDTLGRTVGDRLLRQVSARLRESVGDDTLVVRLGGDEFGVLAPRLSSENDARQLATWLQENMRESYHVEGRSLHLRATIGACMVPRDAAELEEMLRKAAQAVCDARREGVPFKPYEKARDRFTRDGLQIEEALQEAIQTNAFTLHYQPIFNTQTLQPVGAEALTRWRHGELGDVSPGRFIPLAEENGLIVDFDRLTLGNVLGAMAGADVGRDGFIAVNLSARSFHDAHLAGNLAALLTETGYDPGRLVLEITETTAMIDPEATTKVLKELRALGVRIAVDDFGVGYSSLAYLRDFPLDLVKIDRDFVQGLGKGGSDEGIVRTILNLADELGIETLAEGVETETQLAWLKASGCALVQGFLFGRPGPAECLPPLVRS